MRDIIIFAIGSWKFAVQEQELCMILDSCKLPIERWQNNCINEAMREIKPINETDDNEFSNYIFFRDKMEIRCLGVEHMRYLEKKEEEILFFNCNKEDDGILGFVNESGSITSIIDLEKFFDKWRSHGLFMKTNFV